MLSFLFSAQRSAVCGCVSKKQDRRWRKAAALSRQTKRRVSPPLKFIRSIEIFNCRLFSFKHPLIALDISVEAHDVSFIRLFGNACH